MPPRPNNVHNLNERGAADWYWALPPITRSLLTCYLVTGLAAFAGILPFHHLYHSWGLVFKLWIPQVWRLVTNFTFLGKPSITWLFQLVWLVTYGGSYESGKFAHNTADGLTMLGTGMIACMVIDGLSVLASVALSPVFYAPFHGASLVFMFLYLWSRANPEAPVSIFGIIKLSGKHLPFAFLLLDLIMGANPWTDAQGILMGHTYWFLTEVYPQATGRYVIRTPLWLSRLCLRHGIGRVPVQVVNPVNPSDVGFRAFTGRGRRLAD